MKTKFIGLEGFNEIESLPMSKETAVRMKKRRLNTAQKTVRFIKRATTLFGKYIAKNSKNTVKSFKANKSSNTIKRKNVNGRYVQNSRSGKINNNTIQLRTKVRNTPKHAQVIPYDSKRANMLLRRKAMLAVVACSVAATFSCITVANALDASKESSSLPANFDEYIDVAESNNAVNNIETIHETAPNYAVSTATSDEANKLGNMATRSSALVSDGMQAECAGLYIDGNLIGAVTDIQGLKTALNQILTDYCKDYDDATTAEFANDVKILGGAFSENQIKPVNDVIADAKSKFSIALSTDIVYTREIDYETTVEYDDSEGSSYEEVITEGEKGEEEVTIRTTYVDGVQTNAVLTGNKVLKEAVNEVIVRGSSTSDDYINTSNSGYSTGSFIWPIPYTHSISSEFGYRWGRLHGGLDIAAGGIYGQPIIASDSGTVSFSGGDAYSGYGYYVMIDHNNGYSTLYGHCSSLAVSSGQYVNQGDIIGYVGSTGNSTGPHLHFEIRVDGVQTDPLGYVS
ncbi:MAG: peptidoglycan DD-metalloendopeptidase family protein [Ruminococcus sp.]|nr:peptidoglycan DD-metalloendopeptidase family protein [Ruminococcus sp.]